MGDVIERIEDEEVEDLGDFRGAMEKVARLERFLITARRAEETMYLLVKRGVREIEPEAPEGHAGQAAHPGEPGK